MPDLVDCKRLAEESARLERGYALADLPRLKDELAEPVGSLRASYTFVSLSSGRIGAEVAVEATAVLVCQRCMQGCGVALSGRSEVEFAAGDDAPGTDSDRELFEMQDGLVSLRELAEEELLLALPRAFMCDTPLTCGKAPGYATGGQRYELGEMRRPFSTLQDLLKKT